MKNRYFVFGLITLFVFSSLVFSQSKETGAILGTVFDDTNTPLPGVAVTLSSPNLMGDRTVVTGPEGNFRFPALPPGDYVIQAELQGFTKVIQENIRLTTTVKLIVDLTMKPATIEEEATVIAQSPTIDIKSSETASVTLEDEILRNIPHNNYTTSIVNLAPGVNNSSAFGASAGTGISYQVDGVDVSDPDTGGGWVFLDHNIVEEAKVMGLGLPAEYGNFTGVIFNLVTKSGGNEFSGHFEVTFKGKKDDRPNGFWQSGNNSAYIDDFPDLTSPQERLADFGAHLGGPIARDKVWFYIGAQYYRTLYFATGFPDAGIGRQPRLFFKITAQLTPKTNLSIFLEHDRWDGDNAGGASWISPEATWKVRSPEWVGNLSLNHILSSTTFFDLKTAFFISDANYEPEAGNLSAHWSLNDNKQYESAGYYMYGKRSRYQANISLTHYAEDFIQGDHDFKFGVELEHARINNRYKYAGPDALFYVDYVGYGYYGYYNGPYLAYQYEGYDTNTRYTRVEGFVQDSWKVSDRLNLNFGFRLSRGWGSVKDVPGTVYEMFRIAPRVGFTFDLLGDKTTILKAHFGHFTEAMLGAYHERLNPASAYNDIVVYYWDLWSAQWAEFYRIEREDLFKMDESIKHPYMEQFVIGLERELFKNTSLSATFIYRNWKNIIGHVNYAAQWEPVEIYVPELDQNFTVYEQINPNDSDVVIKNIKKGDPGINLDPYRKYWAIELLFHKRFSDNWQILASYIYSQATGTIDNSSLGDIGFSNEWWLPWTYGPNFWINGDGNSTRDFTHMFKLQGTYAFPYGIQLSAYFRAITGNAWTQEYQTRRLAHERVTFLTEKRGSNHYDMQKILDLRLEKIFTIADKYRLGLMFDMFNVFNADTITNWGTRIGYDWIPGEYPSTDGHELYGIVPPRQIRLGLRLMF